VSQLYIYLQIELIYLMRLTNVVILRIGLFGMFKFIYAFF